MKNAIKTVRDIRKILLVDTYEALFVLDLSGQIDKVLQNIAEGVVHPLKTRIEKIVTVSAPSTSFYAVKNLIQFYRNSIREVSAM